MSKDDEIRLKIAKDNESQAEDIKRRAKAILLINGNK